MAGGGEGAVGTSVVALAGVAGVGVNDAAVELRRNLLQQMVHVPLQLPQLLGGGEASGNAALPYGQRQESGLLQRAVLHGAKHLRPAQHQAAASQLPVQGGAEGFRVHSPRLAEQHVPGGQIQRPRRNDLPAKDPLSFSFQREEVEQHLNVQSMAHVAEIKGLFPGFVVHDAHIQPPILQPAVHPVHPARYREGTLPHPHGNGRHVLPLAKSQLKGDGDKVRVGQLVGNIGNNGSYRLPQTTEEVLEPFIPLVEAGQGLVQISLHRRVGEAAQLRLLHQGEAPPIHNGAGDALQNKMEERAHPGGIEARSCPLLGPEAILHEVGEMAGIDLINAAGGHPAALAVQRLHSRRGKTAPAHPRRPLHSGQSIPIPPVLREITPQRSSPLAACQLQGGRWRSQPPEFRAAVSGFPRLRQQCLDPTHHKGGPQG